MNTLPDQGEAEELLPSWNVREIILDIGREAALRLEQWQQMLDLNGEILQSIEKRGASALDLASTRFNDYGPLLRLRRYGKRAPC